MKRAGEPPAGTRALTWFVSGSEYQNSSCFAMACEIVSEDTCRFIRAYNSMERAGIIAVLQWNGGECFGGNNSECK